MGCGGSKATTTSASGVSAVSPASQGPLAGGNDKGVKFAQDTRPTSRKEPDNPRKKLPMPVLEGFSNMVSLYSQIHPDQRRTYTKD